MELGEKELIQSIWRIFMVDQILALGATDNPQETATKTYIRWQIAHQLLGPAADDFERELGNGLTRGFNIMLKAGAFPEMPPILQSEPTSGASRQASLNIRYESPFARAQRAGDIEATQRWINWIFGVEGQGGIVTVYPEARFYPDFGKIVKESAEIIGVPSEWVRNDTVVKDDIAAAKEQEAAQQQMAEVAGMAEAAGKAAPALKALMGGKGEGGPQV
jgi:hypothetical protein